MEKIVNTMQEYPENIMTVWRDGTLEKAIVIERAMKAIEPKTVNSCWENCLDVVHEFRG